ncbi:chemotaxis protein CheW [uncultured Alcanivorax sp.]|uniref:chemotaxis protein CheW n=1 Tax=uncultured Alcanivorax sp. TaxID=191215 RepID=UPI0026048AA3|nr:chemotaxis protein CheW [uncultured Alcanivorax sp.]
MDTKQLICTFSVAGKHYGVVVDNVQEVLANHQITNIPLAPPGVLGLMNIRGRIVPAIALRKVLRLPGESDEEDTINIVINHGGEQVGLMVDCIGDIVSVQPEEIEPPPETLKGAPRKFMRGVFPVQGTLYLLLDLDTLLADELCSRSASRASHSVLQ